MTLIEASAIWVNFKEELKFVCEKDLHLDMNTRSGGICGVQII